MEELKKIIQESIDYHEQGEYEAAEVVLQRAMMWLDRNCPAEEESETLDLFEGQVVPLIEQRKYKSALPYLEHILKLKPNYRWAFAEYIKCLWVLGYHKTFWEVYERRRDFFQNLVIYRRMFGRNTMWDGKSSLDGKKVLVHGEQGAGDQIQFIRYLPLLKEAYDCHIILNCSLSLASLFEQLDCVDEILPKEHTFLNYKPLEFDVHLPMMSLPYHLGIHEPVPEVHFKATREYNLLAWEPDKLHVGFIFTANPHSHGAEMRSLPPDRIWNLMRHSQDKQFFHLHHKEKCSSKGVVNIHPLDFQDLANYVSLMDKIVTIDSALLHLAGSMGKETLALIPRRADWKWEGNTTPWYKSVRLAHQKTSGDWSNVFPEAFDFIQR